MFTLSKRQIVCLAGLSLLGCQAWAQTVPMVKGTTNDGKPFDLGSMRGKVVLLMFWSTNCSVCRDKMPELRQNHAGWSGKPFELVLVSTDAKVKDLYDYEKVLSRTVPTNSRLISLWSGDLNYKDNLGSRAQLPATYVIDKTGKIAGRYMGRIPAETWDKISDLLEGV